MRVSTFLLLAVAVLLAATGTAAAADNSAPLPDAGVDQTVTADSTVYLDANGSVDPDGKIASVAWTIETPDGGTVTPDCEDCRRTEFDAATLGQYTVTLTATDDAGVTRSDTMYVTVTNESGPDVSLSGPGSTRSGTDATFTAAVSKDGASLQTLTWLVNGSVVERASLNGSSAEVSFTHSFDSSAPVQAVVYDTLGERGSATQRMSVSTGGGGGGGSSGCFAIWCGSEADMRYSFGGEQTIIDSNNDGALQTYEDGELVSIDTDAAAISETGGGGHKIDGGVDAVSDEYVTDVEGDSEDQTSADYPDDGDSGDSGSSNSGGSDDGGDSNSGDSGGGGGYRSGIMFQH